MHELNCQNYSQEEVTIKAEEVFEPFTIDFDNFHHEEVSLSSTILAENTLEISNILSYNLKSPLANPKAIRKFICEYCGTAYRRKDSLKQHLLTHQIYTSKTEKHQIHTCPHCKAKFYYLSTYNTHIENVHSEDRPHQCDICQKSYKKKDSLKRHKLMHKNEREFFFTF